VLLQSEKAVLRQFFIYTAFKPQYMNLCSSGFQSDCVKSTVVTAHIKIFYPKH